jgi:rhodanese-related sulfurtransferase
MNLDWGASTEEARELEEMGYRNVLHYAEGKQGWLRTGLPVERNHVTGES